MPDVRWWTMRKGPALLDIEYGQTRATLLGTEFQIQKGPPLAISFSLERNLRGSSKAVGTYVDAQALADGEIRRLRHVHLYDEHVLSNLRHHLDYTADISAPWRLVVMLRGQHEFTVVPEYRDGATLVLRVPAKRPR